MDKLLEGMGEQVICEHWSSNTQKRCQVTFNSSMPPYWDTWHLFSLSLCYWM